MMNSEDANERLRLTHFYLEQRIESEGLRQLDLLLNEYAVQGHIAQIELTLREMIDTYPVITPIRVRLGLLLARVLRFDDAIAELEAAFEVASEDNDKAAAQHILATIMRVRIERGNNRKQ